MTPRKQLDCWKLELINRISFELRHSLVEEDRETIYMALWHPPGVQSMETMIFREVADDT